MNYAARHTRKPSRKRLQHYEEAQIETEEIQATTISVKMCNQSLHLIALYSPTMHNIKTDTYMNLLKIWWKVHHGWRL